MTFTSSTCTSAVHVVLHAPQCYFQFLQETFALVLHQPQGLLPAFAGEVCVCSIYLNHAVQGPCAVTSAAKCCSSVQRATLLAQLKTNEDDLASTQEELNFHLESEEQNYDV